MGSYIEFHIYLKKGAGLIVCFGPSFVRWPGVPLLFHSSLWTCPCCKTRSLHYLPHKGRRTLCLFWAIFCIMAGCPSVISLKSLHCLSMHVLHTNSSIISWSMRNAYSNKS